MGTVSEMARYLLCPQFSRSEWNQNDCILFDLVQVRRPVEYAVKRQRELLDTWLGCVLNPNGGPQSLRESQEVASG